MFPFGARLLLAHFASSSTSTPSALRTLRRSLPLLPRPRFNQSLTMSTGLDIVHTAGAAQPVGPYSQAIKVNGQIFLSGQIPLTKDGVLIEGTIGEKTRLCCENIKAVVEAAGSSVEKIFKVTVLLADMADFDEMNQEYGKFFAHKPARSCFAVKQLPKSVPVEIECIALA